MDNIATSLIKFMSETIFFLIYYLPWILGAITFHEFCHAWVSSKLGDPTPELEGRLTLNPFVHIDLFGMLAMIVFRFGWAKPVMINPNFYKDPMKGTLWVSLAGPGANFLIAILFALIMRICGLFNIWQTAFLNYIFIGLVINLQFGLFNLIPVPPLDGSKILRFFLKGEAGLFFDKYANFGFVVLIAFLYMGIISSILKPSIQTITYLLTGRLINY